MHLDRIKTPEPIAFFISMQDDQQYNWMNPIKLVNQLLHLNISVYWLAEPTDISVNESPYTLAKGDFIIPLQQNNLQDNLNYSSYLPQYIGELSADLNVQVLNFSSNIAVRAYPLKEAKVAVFYGGGTTGGSLEHIQPLEQAGFTLGIIREENLNGKELSEYNVITFPGGGPYNKYLTAEEMEAIRQFVRDGGGFLGTCGGMMVGVELGLLDVEPAMAGEYAASADLRGPVLLNLTQSFTPIVSGCPTILESTYFMGPFISGVGSDVEIVASYDSATENLSLYFPEIMEAYNYTPQQDVIDVFWGSPAILSGKYAAGKVVLSSVHPEILLSSQRLFINSILYLSSSEEIVLKVSEYSAITETPQADLNNENPAQLNETLYSDLIDLMQMFNDKSSNLAVILEGLEETNYQIVGVSGDYLNLFLEDIDSRSSFLFAQLEKLHGFYGDFENFKVRSNASLEGSYLGVSIENLQRKILDVYNSMLELQELIPLLETVEEELLYAKFLLEQISSSTASVAERHQQIFDLHAYESQILGYLKDETNYHLLTWSFETESILVEAHFLNYVTDVYIESS